MLRRLDFNRELADWMSTRGHAFPAEAPVRARAAMIDIVGCILAGALDASAQAVRDTLATRAGGPVQALGSGLLLHPEQAALFVGTAAHALDFDDNFEPGLTHASAVAAPALFAIAGSEDLHGEALIAAFILALEAQARLGRLIGAQTYARGWHATSTIGAMGTAAACAWLLGLDGKGIASAVSIATSMAGGSKIQFGSMMKPVHAGLAAQHAVLAAYLARSGLRGDDDPFGGAMGMVALMSDPANLDGAGAALAGLGERWALAEAGLMAKRFPCCGAAHRTLDGISLLRERHGFEASDIVSIETFVGPIIAQNLRFARPATPEEARFSMHYTAARVAMSGQLSLSDMTTSAISDPTAGTLAAKVTMTIDPAVGLDLGAPVRTLIALADGRVLETSIRDARGTSANPFTAEEAEAKFADCCRHGGVAPGAAYSATSSLAGAPVRNFLFEMARLDHQRAGAARAPKDAQ